MSSKMAYSQPEPQPQSQPGPLVVDLDGLRARAGEVLGHGPWRTVTQDDVDTFARLTGDEQWIHVDPGRAAGSPFGTTIAHGFMTVALSTAGIYEVVAVEGVETILNYGANRVRFPAPLPVGSRVRALVEVPAVEDIPGGVQATFKLTFEREDAEPGAKPVCVAEILFRYYERAPGGGRA
jgi:acyl dehydratase